MSDNTPKVIGTCIDTVVHLPFNHIDHTELDDPPDDQDTVVNKKCSIKEHQQTNIVRSNMCTRCSRTLLKRKLAV